jgi:hypothetical protein
VNAQSQAGKGQVSHELRGAQLQYAVGDASFDLAGGANGVDFSGLKQEFRRLHGREFDGTRVMLRHYPLPLACALACGRWSCDVQPLGVRRGVVRWLQPPATESVRAERSRFLARYRASLATSLSEAAVPPESNSNSSDEEYATRHAGADNLRYANGVMTTETAKFLPAHVIKAVVATRDLKSQAAAPRTNDGFLRLMYPKSWRRKKEDSITQIVTFDQSTIGQVLMST